MIVRNVPIDSFIAARVFLSSKKAKSIVTRGVSPLGLNATALEAMSVLPANDCAG
jgi:hypothetical protein